MTPYTTIFQRFLQKIEDKDLVNFTLQEQTEMLIGWLDTAIGYIELDQLKIKNDLSKRDNSTQEFLIELSNGEIEAIALYMVAAWYEPRINSLEHTLLLVGSKDEKWTDQNKHMEMMIAARDRAKLEARKYFRNYGYKTSSYLNGGVQQ